MRYFSRRYWALTQGWYWSKLIEVYWTTQCTIFHTRPKGSCPRGGNSCTRSRHTQYHSNSTRRTPENCALQVLPPWWLVSGYRACDLPWLWGTDDGIFPLCQPLRHLRGFLLSIVAVSSIFPNCSLPYSLKTSNSQIYSNNLDITKLT